MTGFLIAKERQMVFSQAIIQKALLKTVHAYQFITLKSLLLELEKSLICTKYAKPIEKHNILLECQFY